jgi:hypothetical protein
MESIDNQTFVFCFHICHSVIKQLFDYSGDILAQQYAGSQLVHRIDTYKKLTPAWSTQPRDIVQTLSRYYSTTFSGWTVVIDLPL